MWSTIPLLLVTATLVCAASTRRDAAAADCHQVTRLALKLRDKLKGDNDWWYDRQVKAGMVYMGVNLDNDEQMENLFCMFIEAENKTIREIAESSWDLFQTIDETKMSFFYSTVLNYMKSTITQMEMDLSWYGKRIEFYDLTGFPNFPSKLNKAKLIKLLSEFDAKTLNNLIYWMADYDENDEPIFQMEKFATLYTESSSLEEFVRGFIEPVTPDPYSYYSSYSGNDYEIEYRINDTLQMEEVDREHYNYNKDMSALIIPLEEALESSGFMSVTRGGPPLYTCDFIADTAVEAFGYAVEIFGSETVQRTLTRDLDLELQVGNECALRSLVCSIMSVKTREELKNLIPKRWFEHFGNFDHHYFDAAGAGMYMLVNPGEYLGEGMSYIRLVKAAERVGFPNFPLSMTKAQAQQLVVMMDKPFHMHGGHPDLVQKLLDSDSLEEAVDDHYEIRRLKNVVDFIGGKTDIALTLASCLYRLAMNAEELGLFMLP